MPHISRRRILSWAAIAPVAVATGAAVGVTGKPSPSVGKLTPSELAAHPAPPPSQRPSFHARRKASPVLRRPGQGQGRHLNFFFAKCDEVCPRVTANLEKVQKLVAADLGRTLFMYSFTLKPEEDDVDAIRHYREMYYAQPGWTFLTGKPADMETLRKGIGFTYPDPAIDNDKTQHIGNIRYGNEPLMLWSACPGMAHAEFVAESISWMLRPEASHVQPS